MHCQLHTLAVPNAFDAMSARVFEEAGFRAIPPASIEITFSRRYPDGEVMPRREMMEAVRRIARAVDAPVGAEV